MTMKSTLIVPITLLATLVTGVLVHDSLGTKPYAEDEAPTRTASIATAKPAAPAPVGSGPVSAPVPAFVEDEAPTRTASIATAKPAAPAPVSPSPVSAPAPSATPEPPRRMTASQEASLDAWLIKTYLACWNPSALPADADPYVARVRLKFKPDGSLLKPPKLVNPPSDPAQKPQAKSVLQAVKRATLYRCRLNTAPFMGNGRPRPSTSIRGLPPADPGHEPTMSASVFPADGVAGTMRTP
jgi:hypothetical protein